MDACEISIIKGGGIHVKHKDDEFLLDPAVGRKTFFTSHAHMDHLPRRIEPGSRMISSQDTLNVFKQRVTHPSSITTDRVEHSEACEGIKLHDAGHMIGSCMAEIDTESCSAGGTILYTGDFNPHDRLFMKGASPLKCDTLIIESTFAGRECEFPKQDEIIRKVSDWLSGSGRNAILFGYPYGKAQILTALANHLGFIPICHGSVYAANRMLRNDSHGACLDCIPYGGNDSTSIMEDEDAKSVIIAPTSLAKSAFTKKLKDEFGSETAVFTGWAHKPRCSSFFGVDEAFPLSDHADGPSIREFVRGCDPERIITVHEGENDDSALNDLKREGYDIKSLRDSGRIEL